MSDQNSPGKSLQERRGAAGLNLTGPMPDVVIERAVAERHNMQLPAQLPQGIRSHHASPIEGPVNHPGALGADTGATLTYGNWASNLPAPARQPEALAESATPLSSTPSGQEQQQPQLQQDEAPAQGEGGAESADSPDPADLWLVFPEEEEGALPPAPPTPTLERQPGSPTPISPLALDSEQTPATTDQMAASEATNMYKPGGRASWGLDDEADPNQLPAFFFKLASEEAREVLRDQAGPPPLPGFKSTQTLPVDPTKALERHAQIISEQSNTMSPSSSSVTFGHPHSSSFGPDITMHHTPQTPVWDRWNEAVGLVHNETVKVFIRGCFCAGKRLPLSLAIHRDLVVGEMATRLMSDLRVIVYQLQLARCLFRAPHNLRNRAISPAQLREYQLEVDEQVGRLIITKLLEGQSFGQVGHAGKAVCSQSLRGIVDIVKPLVDQEQTLGRNSGWDYLGGLTEALVRNFMEFMVTQIAIYGSHPQDQQTVHGLAYLSNKYAIWCLSSGRFFKATELAQLCLDLIRNTAISPPADWYPRGYRHTYDFDQDITEYKTVIYRKQKSFANKILVCGHNRRVLGPEFIRDLMEPEVYNFEDIEEDPEDSIWDMDVADPANILG
ncbi:hypothetical protein V8F06_011630 [Rhypophila decipiens]